MSGLRALAQDLPMKIKLTGQKKAELGGDESSLTQSGVVCIEGQSLQAKCAFQVVEHVSKQQGLRLASLWNSIVQSVRTDGH